MFHAQVDTSQPPTPKKLSIHFFADSNGSSSDSQHKSPEKQHHPTVAPSEKLIDVQSTPSRSISQQKLYVKLPEVDHSRKTRIENGITPTATTEKEEKKPAPPRPPPIRSPEVPKKKALLPPVPQLDSSPNAKKVNGHLISSPATRHQYLKINGTHPQFETPATPNLNFHVPAKSAQPEVPPKPEPKPPAKEIKQELDDVFANFNSFALPSCAKMLTTGVAAPILAPGDGSPSLSTASFTRSEQLAMPARQHVRTYSAVETDL